MGGAAISLWVFISGYNLFTEPENLLRYQEIVSSNLETTITIAEKEGVKVVVPTEILSYFVALVLLMIAVSTASVLIGGGARLLDGDLQRLSRKLSTVSDRACTKLDDIKEVLQRVK